MSKRKIRIIAIVAAVLTAVTVLGVIGISLTVEDSLFNTDTPMRITCNSTVVGTIENKEDYEAFVFEVEKPGALVVKLQHDNLIDTVKCGYVLTLYKIIEGENNTYQEITYFESFWSETTSSWGETGVSAGTYVVVVEPGVDIIFGDFTLVTAFTATPAYEKEPNNIKEASNEVKVGESFYASSSQLKEGTDVDWYRFELEYDSCIDISFIHDDLTFPTSGWNIKILTEDEQVVCDYRSLLTDIHLKTGTIGLKAGTYYIKVESQTPVADTYSVLIAADKAKNHEFEMNDTPETSTDLPQGIAITGALAEKLLSLDKDYYKFTVPADGYVEFYFKHSEIEGDKNGWNIRLMKQDDNGEYYQVVKKMSKWKDKDVSVYSLGLAAGDYYIVIDADSLAHNSATYSIQWNFTAKENFEKEPNNVMKRAQTISFNEYYYGAIISSDMIFDEDYYKLEITEDMTVNLELGHEIVPDGSISWIASIVDEDNEALYSIESSPDDGVVSTGDVKLSQGTYYVKIETGMYESEIPYYFRVSVS